MTFRISNRRLENVRTYQKSLQQLITQSQSDDIITLKKVHHISDVIDFTKPLVIQGGIIEMSTHGLIRAQSNNVIFNNVTFFGNNVDMLRPQTNNYQGWEFNNCIFNGVSLKLLKSGYTLLDSSVITVGTVKANVSGCEFLNVVRDNCIMVAFWDGIEITNCYLHDYGISIDAGDGIKITYGATNTLIDSCVLKNSTRDGIDTFYSAFTTINNCIIDNTQSLSIDLKNLETTPLPNMNKGHVVTNNQISNSALGGVFAYLVDDLVFYGNTVNNTGTYGIYLSGDNNNVYENVFSNSDYDMRIEATANLNADVLTNNNYETLLDLR